jgi:class 3 adenylate cyclase/predicted ATPase
VAGLPSGTVTFLFTDIEGSTSLWDAFPDDMRAALTMHDALVTAAVTERGGHVVKSTGDGIFAAFDSALGAAAAAVDAQAGLAAAAWPTVVGSLGVRMALHTATIEPDEGDYHGSDVNRVARIEAAGNGGQILMSEATAALISGALPAGAEIVSLGTHLLRGLSVPEHIHQLTAPGQTGSYPPLKTVTTTTAKLPEFATSFVGRAAEIDAIAERAADPASRVISLVGTGGAGKTRLAVEAARRCADEQRVVAHFLSLVPVSSVDGLVKALAESLDFTIDLHLLSPGFTEKRQVFDRLAMYPTVLVLDNFEHMIEHAGFVHELVTELPNVTVIVTSRQRLGIQAEWIHAVGGLSSGAEDARTLFLERSRQLGGAVHDQDPAIDTICGLVGGLPLGIELAAAWTPILPPSEVAKEISANLDFLAATSSDLPDRHRSLRAVFEYSWNLLDPTGREALARLAVFPSSFTREAAVAIAGTQLPGLFDLLQKSLLQRNVVDRFDLHPLVREFALEKLGADRATLEEAHARFFTRLLLSRAADLAGSSNQVGVRDEVAEEFDHIRVAAEWFLVHEEAGVCLAIADALLSFFFLYSWSEGAAILGRLAAIRAQATSEDHVYLMLKMFEYEFAANFLEPAELREEIMRLLPALEEMGGRGLMWGYGLLGVASFMSGDLGPALEWFERAEAIDAERDTVLNIFLPAWHGWTRLLVGEPERGNAIFAKAEAEARAAGAELGKAYLLSKLGIASDQLGDHEAAVRYHGGAQDVFVKFDDPSGQGYALSRLSVSWFRQGDHELAVRYALEGLERFESVNHRWGMVISRCRAAFPEIELGRIDQALERLREALDLAERAGMKEPMFYALTGIGRAWAASERDEQAALLLSFSDSPDNPYREYAGPVLETIANRMDPAQMSTIRHRSTALDLDAAARLARNPG